MTPPSKELISMIETKNVGFNVSISRNVKVGRTATETTTIRMEGAAEDLASAKAVLAELDKATKAFIEAEAAFYNINLKEQPSKLSALADKP